MTKTLTEQWREGTLPEDCYYILTKNGHIRKDRTCFYSHTDEQCFCFTSNRDIEEVLAPVPSYDEYKRLQKQLKEANKAIKEYAWDSGYWECGYHHKDSFFADIYIEKWGVK